MLDSKLLKISLPMVFMDYRIDNLLNEVILDKFEDIKYSNLNIIDLEQRLNYCRLLLENNFSDQNKATVYYKKIERLVEKNNNEYNKLLDSNILYQIEQTEIEDLVCSLFIFYKSMLPLDIKGNIEETDILDIRTFCEDIIYACLEKNNLLSIPKKIDEILLECEKIANEYISLIYKNIE